MASGKYNPFFFFCKFLCFIFLLHSTLFKMYTNMPSLIYIHCFIITMVKHAIQTQKLLSAARKLHRINKLWQLSYAYGRFVFLLKLLHIFAVFSSPFFCLKTNKKRLECQEQCFHFVSYNCIFSHLKCKSFKW